MLRIRRCSSQLPFSVTTAYLSGFLVADCKPNLGPEGQIPIKAQDYLCCSVRIYEVQTKGISINFNGCLA
ncbi:hypothetical protein HNY73_022768 [Argiope bruennichi]|uniref:Uncharacterized protein n=1 Tax=Argiope bruennichi TaxID=94029 RepID=A0A8T0E1N6_ARGBR|nr:hypothetical protein HNY73_022768 [Argiope bruennichi]